MKRYMTFIAAVLCIGMMSTAASAQKEIDYTKMVEDTEIMSRIIDKTMKEAFKEAYVEPGFFRRGCQGFYLKGYGVVFLVGSRLRWLPFNATWRNHYRLSVY